MAVWGYDKLLANKDILFKEKSYDEKQFEASAYQLRLGRDELLIGGTYYEKFPGDVLYLPPGQSAFLSSEEILSLPYNMEGRVVLRYSYGVRGLTMLLGGHFDPLYEGRAFLILHNATDESIPLVPGSPIAKISFFTVEYKEKDETKIQKQIEAKFARKPNLKLPEQVRVTWGNRVTSRLDANVADHTKKIGEIEKQIAGFAAVTQYVIMGGALVIAITVLAAVLQTVFGTWNSVLSIGSVVAGSQQANLAIWLLLIPVFTTVLFMVFIGGILVMLAKRLGRRSVWGEGNQDRA